MENLLMDGLQFQSLQFYNTFGEYKCKQITLKREEMRQVK